MNTIKVGDKIRVQNTFNDYKVEIVRVTKTMAIAKTPYNNEMRFRLNCGAFGPQPLPRQRFQTTIYTLIQNN